ncbi:MULTISPECIES: hypothetical protein [Kordiimonas]|uniref:hypothetical protein n=1 Tax=Kordiimonas TaxID=288021 RepID=UPI00257A2A77|nr:hypothetical protein [Kordiimonas sp. UBA4487]
MADADQPLLGFEEWLGEKYGVSNPFVWPLFVHRLFRGVDGVKPEAEVSSQTDLAFDLLDEFLLERSSDVS